MSSASSSPNPTITVEKKPSEARLAQLGIKSWPKWGCSPGTYQLKFDAEETCYLVRGRVRAYVKRPPPESEFVEFGAGDLVVIPKGISCTWHVSVAVDKYYKFDSS
uniref:(S)-ureidoglycine aminohydrolase cupin domain-containing protein n=1 Tax=Kalanchoe fedtschenkoi TaxID=63787 RepID=A0A7N0TNN7_KALFE